MAKPVKGGGGTSHIRMFVIEATVPEGELAAVTTAIQNAFKPAAPAVRLPAKPASLPNGNGTAAFEPEPEDIEGALEETVAEPPQPRVPRAKRTVKMPKAVPIEMDAAPTLADFAADKDVGSQAKKYMVCAAWLKDTRGIDAVTEGHIYTCFKKMDWSTNIPDFGQPLRDLKAKQQYFEKSDKGYEINHLGLDFVKKLTRKAG